MVRSILVLLCFLGLSTYSSGQDYSGFPSASKYEIWYGVINQPRQHLRTIFYWDKSEQPKEMTSISIDQRMASIPITAVKSTKEELRLELSSVDGVFEGAKTDETHANGFWKQRGVDTPMSLERIEHLPKENAELILVGKLNAIVRKLDFQFRIYDRHVEGDITKAGKAYFDSLTEQITSILCDYEEKGDEITIAAPALGIKFTGKRNQEGVIDGTFSQGPLPLTLVLEPTAQVRWGVERRRPQIPQAPFPYRAIEFEASNPNDKAIKLAGTVTLPEKEGKNEYPAVILVSGSGAQDRDETIEDHKLFLVIADALTRQGYAVLRYDDRGTAKSTGDFATATTDDFAMDVEGVIRFAKTHPEINPKKVFVLGHSEGGIIAPTVAHWNPDLAGIIMLAGPGYSGDKILEQQSERIEELSGVPSSVRKASLAMRQEIHGMLQNGIESTNQVNEIRAAVEKYWPALRASSAGDEAADQARIDDLTNGLKVLQTPWFQRFLAYDPAPTMMLVQCPVLGLWGELDSQVIPQPNLSRIEEAVIRGGNTRATLLVLPGLNHLFQPATTGSPEEYGNIETTIEPKVLEILIQWLKDQS